MIMLKLDTFPARVLALAFDNESEFKQWAKELSPYDAEYWRIEFEKEEMYEFCAMLRDVILENQKNITYLYNGL